MGDKSSYTTGASVVQQAGWLKLCVSKPAFVCPAPSLRACVTFLRLPRFAASMSSVSQSLPSPSKQRRLRSAATKAKSYDRVNEVNAVMLIHSQLAMITSTLDWLVMCVTGAGMECHGSQSTDAPPMPYSNGINLETTLCQGSGVPTEPAAASAQTALGEIEESSAAVDPSCSQSSVSKLQATLSDK